MRVSDHSLRQLDEGYLRTLKTEALQDLSVRLLADLKDARDRLGAGPWNSSQPPGSRPAWEQGLGRPTGLATGIAQVLGAAPTDLLPVDSSLTDPAALDPAPIDPAVTDPAPTDPASTHVPTGSARRERAVPKHVGKQIGAAGVGRTQVLTAQEHVQHRPQVCAGCGQALAVDAPAQDYTGFQSADVRFGDPTLPGLLLKVTDHRFADVVCACGHRSRAEAARGKAEPGISALELCEWRLVGPGLATLIVALSMRFRMSRARIAEFLDEWMGLHLSTGTIHQTLHEAAAVVAPAEDEMVAAAVASGVLHADETPWPEQGRILWLWVFCSATVVLYYIAHRGRELLNSLLPDFAGWLMSDGWVAYRAWPRRLRCWPHLIRKACGLAESHERTAQAFGEHVLGVFKRLIHAIHSARDGPHNPPQSIADDHSDDLRALREACECRRSSPHPKTRALAVELLADWDAIFQVLAYPHLPMTNNDAERNLRHWVILRRLSHGTRTEQGSRYFALLASVIDTCRLRGQSPWTYLQDAIRLRRAGQALPPLPG